jgi:hypothetical protein
MPIPPPRPVHRSGVEPLDASSARAPGVRNITVMVLLVAAFGPCAGLATEGEPVSGITVRVG